MLLIDRYRNRQDKCRSLVYHACMSRYALITVVFSAVLLLWGVGFYIGTGMKNVTALIPAFFGIPLGVCGLLSRTPRSTKIAMHVAVVIALLGALAPLGRLVPNWSASATTVKVEMIGMMGLCAALVVVYVKSFIDARRAGGDAA